MVRIWLVFFVGNLFSGGVMAQLKKQFSIENTSQCEEVRLSLKAKTGNCYVRPSQNSDLLNVYSNQDLEEYGHQFSKEVIGQQCNVKLQFHQHNKDGLGHKISYQVLGANSANTDKFWKVYLSDVKPYILDFDFGLGNANIDLSGLAVKKFKINTGSADVNIAYASGIENQVSMDTFLVKVDVGSVNVKQLYLARSKNIFAEVGFGNLSLDLQGKPLANHLVKCSVGAGNLIIMLPDEDVPLLVKVSDSWLCSVQLSKRLKKIGENKYANTAYTRSPQNALTFDLDVSMGKIVLKD